MCGIPNIFLAGGSILPVRCLLHGEDAGVCLLMLAKRAGIDILLDHFQGATPEINAMNIDAHTGSHVGNRIAAAQAQQTVIRGHKSIALFQILGNNSLAEKQTE